jgi:hypothetical protein
VKGAEAMNRILISVTIFIRKTTRVLLASLLLFVSGCEKPYNQPPVEILEPTEGLREGFVGLTETQARASARSRNVPFRVVHRNGKDLAVTFDFRRGRVNAEVRENVVVAYSVEGEPSEPTAKPDP